MPHTKIQNLGSKISRIRRELLRWYEKTRRDLPWRRARDPYAIWIAETMLQQTQVRTILPYYRRFLSTLPTVEALDRALTARVLALWSGLGYYRRAENLKKAARIIIREHGGKIPADYDALRALPGIGPYTAGALMSFAFNRPYPAIDGNARRVLTRLFIVSEEMDIREIAERLVSSSKPGRFNQALMELGSRICLPQEPRCPICPVATSCAARRSGRPLTTAPKTNGRTQSVDWPLLVIQDGVKVLLRRRSHEGILAGLWEVPGGERRREESLRAAVLRHLDGFELPGKLNGPVGEIRHSITYRRIRAPLFHLVCQRESVPLPSPAWRWFSVRSLNRHPVSALTLKALRLIPQR